MGTEVGVPPLPPGFSLDNTLPPLPAGFSVDQPPPPQPLAQVAAKRKLGIQQQTSMEASSDAASLEKKLKFALGAVKTGAAMTPFLIAAPFTGGASLGAAAAIGAASGLGSGAIREGLDAATGEPNKSASQIAKSLTFDTVLGLGGELGFRQIAKIGGAALEGAALRAAAKSSKGALAIKELENSAHQDLQSIVAGKVGNYKQVYQTFVDDMAKIPQATRSADPAMKALAGEPAGGAVGDLFHKVQQTLTPSVDPLTGVATHIPTEQPLDVLIRAHSAANQMAFDAARGAEGKVSTPVQVALAKFADGLRGVITSNLTPAERSAFEATKDITKLRMESTIAGDLATAMAKKALAGTVGGMVGHLPGAAAGVAAEQIASSASKRYAPAILEWLVDGDKMAVQKAIKNITANPRMLDSYATQFFKQIPKGVLKSLPVQAANATPQGQDLKAQATQEEPNAAQVR